MKNGFLRAVALRTQNQKHLVGSCLGLDSAMLGQGSELGESRRHALKPSVGAQPRSIKAQRWATSCALGADVWADAGSEGTEPAGGTRSRASRPALQNQRRRCHLSPEP